MRTRMQHQERQTERGSKLDLLNERFERLLAVCRRPGRKIDKVSGVAKNARQAAVGQFVRIKRQLLHSMRFAEPSHVVFHENLAHLRSDLFGPLKCMPDPT